ncbi:hypothetical protein PtrSN002B_009481 [Pyrenophora tritici-repentis]|uniref:Uncharacterized protein n=2 Tax=Pyrenophora tritici-repentis TaxID=45151 RepID=A0A2W1DKT9_9PLEO|nr:uncharacterized protein PTRG_06510 [Pyrenophora tritici-repentis Pt-1C-BFP]KAA8613592.1 hypothetical protein PtrV1_12500 [Pyrenophora tritici-repentis]EDU49430.1 predicted protein [Pyrenophora tritici-repentis Pt-1C-BFP]KAF7445300.1 hypothetical protein A1F99_102860 [Pyrenophora tritici-repentis]KAF7565569.1 hypothetical protein PtrM4_050030 [Pyrenophora tritici-repentis]KAG9380305.1 hypothetical protein A1F94_009200 [Pyrenophora tritici-repentis]
MASQSNENASAGRDSSPRLPSSSSREPTDSEVIPKTAGPVAPIVPGTESPNSVTINFGGTRSTNSVQVLIGISNATDVRGSGPTVHVKPQYKSRPEDRRSPCSNSDRDDSPRPSFDDRYPRREVPAGLEQIVNEVADVVFSAAVDRPFNSTVQHPFPDEPIAGITLWDAAMNEPVKERDQSDYKVGQICMVYVLEPSANPHLKKEQGHTAVRTSVGLLAGKWRPAIIVDVLEKHCVVAEMGRRSNRVFEGLSLYGLLERCGVITKVNAGEYDPENEQSELFRSIYEPLRVDHYYRECRPLERDSAVQFFRLNSKSFDFTCSPIGELTEESTRRLLNLPSLSKHMKQKAEGEHGAYMVNNIYELTPRRSGGYLDYDYRKAILNLKKDVEDSLATSDDDGNTEGNDENNNKHHSGDNDDLYQAPSPGAPAATSTTAPVTTAMPTSRDELKRKRDASPSGGANKRPSNTQ